MKYAFIMALAIAAALFAVGVTHAQIATSPPEILNIETYDVEENGVQIIWDTNRPTIGYVDVFEKERFVARLTSPGEARTHHEITVRGLDQKTKYELILKVRDPSTRGVNGFAKSAPRLFKTEKHEDTTPPTVTTSTVQIYFKTETTAYITWESNEPTYGLVSYGEITGPAEKRFENFNRSRKSDAGYASVHDVVLTSLKPNTSYVFKVKSYDKDDNEVWVSKFTFSTLQLPDPFGDKDALDDEELKITHAQPASQNSPLIGVYTATTTWKTNRPTEGTVTYKAIRDGKVRSTKRVETNFPRKLEHQVVLNDLEPKTEYQLEIKAVDGKRVTAYMTGVRFVTHDGPPRPVSSAPSSGSGSTGGSAHTREEERRERRAAEFTASEGLYKTADSSDIWTIMRGQRHKITSEDAFIEYNYSASAVQTVSAQQLNRFPVARFVKAPGEKNVYRIYPESGIKVLVPDEQSFHSYSGADFRNVITISEIDLANIKDAQLVRVPGRTFLYSIDQKGKKHLLKNGETTARNMGLDPGKAADISFEHLSKISSGEILQ